MPDRRAGKSIEAQQDRFADVPHGKNLQVALARVIEAEILPRLLIALGTPQTAGYPRKSPPAGPAPGEVAEFARFLMVGDPLAARAVVQIIRGRGAPLECIYTELMAPAAPYLRGLWEADQCSFAQLNVGLRHLVSLLRDIANVQH